MAKAILADCESKKRTITEIEVLAVLRAWVFRKNYNRKNVMKTNVEWVHSDTLGLIRFQSGGFIVADATQEHPQVTQVMTKWLHDQCPTEIGTDFQCTSISVNKNYGGRLHRDAGNEGPSILMSLGDFTGGELNYWPLDTGNNNSTN